MAAPPTASASATPERLPAIELRANLSEAPAAWARVVHVPFGTGTADLDYEPSHESGPVEPSSFAVAPDGSIWIADPGNSRVAHYATSGAFLGSVPTGPLVHDLAFAGDDLFAILDSNHGKVADLSRSPLTPVTIERDGRAVSVLFLRPGMKPLAGDIGIFADGSDNDRQGLARLDLSDGGTYTPLAAMPLPDGRSVSVTDADPTPTGQEIDVTFPGSTTQTQPIDVSLIASAATSAHSMDAVIGQTDVVPAGNGVAMLVVPRRVARRTSTSATDSGSSRSGEARCSGSASSDPSPTRVRRGTSPSATTERCT